MRVARFCKSTQHWPFRAAQGSRWKSFAVDSFFSFLRDFFENALDRLFRAIRAFGYRTAYDHPGCARFECLFGCHDTSLITLHAPKRTNPRCHLPNMDQFLITVDVFKVSRGANESINACINCERRPMGHDISRYLMEEPIVTEFLIKRSEKCDCQDLTSSFIPDSFFDSLGTSGSVDIEESWCERFEPFCCPANCVGDVVELSVPEQVGGGRGPPSGPGPTQTGRERTALPTTHI